MNELFDCDFEEGELAYLKKTVSCSICDKQFPAQRRKYSKMNGMLWLSNEGVLMSFGWRGDESRWLCNNCNIEVMSELYVQEKGYWRLKWVKKDE